MFMLANSMNISASSVSRRRRTRAADELASQLEHQFIRNKYQIENNTCPATTFPYGSSDIDYIPKREPYSVFNVILVLFCVIGVIWSNPVYTFVKIPTPMYERP